MVHKVTVRDVDGELGVVFPRGTVERIGLVEGDTLCIEERHGQILLTPPDLHEALEIYERGCVKYANVLRALADS
jgi:bifunctional DNA-binding transcriptional regulator/antitoxin component of YhaV-PrlF toxin-antitoxin module